VRACAWCRGPIAPTARRDAVTCSKRCRQARHRVSRYASPRAGRDGCVSAGAARRFAYADPPYPGKAALYYAEHPDYAGEVDHAALLARLATFDGWALSTSAAALPAVLAQAVAQDLPVCVASWTRGPRPHATARARYPVNAWEPVVYVPAPSRTPGEGRVDALVHGVAVMRTLPSRVVGTKPAAVCRWIFDLMGARPGDSFTDLFPGSGIVATTWDLFARGAVPAGGDAA
jgi:hypothetical protein